MDMPFLFLLQPSTAQRDASSLMGLISTKDIAELTQIATELAAQTMHSNGELMSKPGRPEVRDLSLDVSPSQLLGQGLTNMWQPASQQLAKSLMGQQPAAMASAKQSPLAEMQPLFSNTAPRYNSRPRAAAAAGTGGGAMNSIMELASTFLGGADRTAGPARTEAVGGGNQMGELISSMTGGNRPASGANQMSELISSMTGVIDQQVGQPDERPDFVDGWR
uniref:Uncharacterized protein n=1 Tax=Ditylenchus dipsaci TaxID=166011 RepID=A0A915D1T4_9BILA